MANRARTSEERRKYVGDITYKPTCADLD